MRQNLAEKDMHRRTNLNTIRGRRKWSHLVKKLIVGTYLTKERTAEEK